MARSHTVMSSISLTKLPLLGARIGFSDPSFEGQVDSGGDGPYSLTQQFFNSSFEVAEDFDSTTVPISIVEPTIGQFIAALDGMEVDGVILETATEAKLDDGTPVTVSSVEVRFLKPPLLTRFLRLGTRPDAAFFFLLAGLFMRCFESFQVMYKLATIVLNVPLDEDLHDRVGESGNPFGLESIAEEPVGLLRSPKFVHDELGLIGQTDFGTSKRLPRLVHKPQQSVALKGLPIEEE